MEPHLKTRPQKTPFPIQKQLELQALAIEKIKTTLLPNAGIKKIVLIGSSVKGTFGTYASPGFRGSLYSDFDFIIFVTDAYQIPKTLTPEPDGKPFDEDELNLAYRESNFLLNKYDAEIFFIRESSLNNPKVITAAEQAGIPATKQSKHPSVQVYSQSNN